jgi:hypothetical protein
MSIETIPFYLYTDCEALLKEYHQKIKSTLHPLPSERPWNELLVRIRLIILSCLIYPVLLIGTAIQKLHAYRVYHQNKPKDFNFELNYESRLLSIPNELQELIAQKAEITDLIAFSQTCKQVRQQFLYSILPNYINVTHQPIQAFKFHPICLDHALLHIGSKLSHLKLTKVTPQIAQRWISFCPNLVDLKINDPTDPLRFFRIEWRIRDDDWFCPLVEQKILKIEKLKHLSLRWCHIRASEAEKIVTFKNLTHLDLCGCLLSAEGIHALTAVSESSEADATNISTSQLTRLTYLDLSFTQKYYGGYPVVSPFLPDISIFQGLRELRFDGFIFNNDKFSEWLDILQKLPHLETLSLAYSVICIDNTRIDDIDEVFLQIMVWLGYYMNDQKAALIAQKLPNLISLNLKCNPHLTSGGIIQILKALKKLRAINISLTNIRFNEIPQIIDELLNLPNFSQLIYNLPFDKITEEEQQLLEEQTNRLLTQFPDCDIIFDNSRFLTPA